MLSVSMYLDRRNRRAKNELLESIFDLTDLVEVRQEKIQKNVVVEKDTN